MTCEKEKNEIVLIPSWIIISPVSLYCMDNLTKLIVFGV